MNSPTISVLVVGYNSSEDVHHLLESLRNLPSWADCELLVAENGTSEIHEMEKVAREFSAVFLKLPNPGFGKACNALARLARGEILLLANPDLRFDKDIVPTLRRHLGNPDVGAVGPLLRNEDGTEQISWNLPMGLWWEFLEAHGLQTWWRKRLMRQVRKRSPQGPWNVGFVTAACVAITRNLYHRLGGFHEEFFLNSEDIDLGDRINALGLNVLVDPTIEAFHGNSRIQGKDLQRFVSDRLDGKWVYLPRRYRGWRLVVARLFWLETILIRITVGFAILRGTNRTRLPGYWNSLVKAVMALPDRR